MRRAVSEEEGGCLLVVVVTGEAAAGSAVTGSPRDMKQQVRRRGAEQRGLEGAWLGRAPGLAGQAEPLLWSGFLSHSSPASLRGTRQALTCAFAVQPGPSRQHRAWPGEASARAAKPAELTGCFLSARAGRRAGLWQTEFSFLSLLNEDPGAAPPNARLPEPHTLGRTVSLLGLEFQRHCCSCSPFRCLRLPVVIKTDRLLPFWNFWEDRFGKISCISVP